MPTQYTLSKEVSYLKRSVLRELLAHAVDPAIISLATGLPASECLPIEDFRHSLNTVLEWQGARAMQYSPQYVPLREWLAGYMQSRGVACTPQQVVITNGCEQGLNILSRLFLDHGDSAVIEAATFTGVKMATAGRGVIVHTLPTNLETGADIDALEAALKQAPRPRLIILIPDFHNPLGVSISAEKRQRAAQLAAEYGVPLVEDDPYSPLRFAGEVPLPIKAHDEGEMVFYLGSFSKMLAPAVRLGWLVAPQELTPQIAALRESMDLESSALMQRAVYDFLQRGLLEPHLERLNATNRERCAALMTALNKHLGDIATWTKPEGGLFAWVTLPEHIDTTEMLTDAIDNKVVYIPGHAFAVGDTHHNAMRLNFSNVQPGQFDEALGRLSDVIRKRL